MHWATHTKPVTTSLLKRSGARLCDLQGRDVVRLAEENNFSVSKVSSLLGLKVYQFKAAIEQAVGMGPKEFFRHHRAVLARWMISEGSPLRIISDKLGFRYYTHFAAEIRTFYGVPPRELQKIIKSNSQNQDSSFQVIEKEEDE